MSNIYCLKSVALLLSFLMLGSCATLFQGTKKRVTITSLTPGTKIYVDGEYKGMDNVRVKLKRRTDHTVIGKKEGYENANAFINKEFQFGWLVFDFFLNPFAFLVDPFTGSWHTFDKDRIGLDLIKKK